MCELNEAEIELVDGGSLAYDIGKSIGMTVGGAIRGAMEYVYNQPFRDRYS